MTRRMLLRLLMAFGLTGCLHAAPLPEPHIYRMGATTFVAPAEAPVCTSTRTAHNFWLLGGVAAGSLSGAGALAVSVETDQSAKLATVIISGLLGVAAAVMTAAAGITADTYTRNCTVGR